MTFVYSFLGLFILAVVYPLVYVLSCSFSSPGALISGKVFLLPVDFSVMGYRAVFKSIQVWIGYRNTILYTSVYTVMSVFITMMVAFPLSRSEFPAKKAITWLFTVTMFISGGLIPNYLLVKYIGIMDTMWALIVPSLLGAWSVIITRTFIRTTIPEELFEASSLDGSGYIQYFIKIVLPLSKPIMAVLALGCATGMWNSYFSALLYISDSSKFPLQIVLRNILVQNNVDFTAINSLNLQDMMARKYLGELLKYSLIVVSSVPLLIFYPFIQKYFIKGVMVGSIKG
jgi:putative aldouronate transport system permease protein